MAGVLLRRWAGSAHRTMMRATIPILRSPHAPPDTDRKSTRLNSSHLVISYAVFCLKKKNNNQEAFDAVQVMAQRDGIIPAVEAAHAVAYAFRFFFFFNNAATPEIYLFPLRDPLRI